MKTMYVKKEDIFYDKEVEISDNCVNVKVSTYVENSNGNIVELRTLQSKFYVLGRLEKRLKKAHKWADNLIKLAKEQECGIESYATFD